MTKTSADECNCTNCGKPAVSERRNYRYTESGIPNVVLQGVTVADCPACGKSDVSIPRMATSHRAIARAITNSPARLTGPQLRFLRKHRTHACQAPSRLTVRSHATTSMPLSDPSN